MNRTRRMISIVALIFFTAFPAFSAVTLRLQQVSKNVRADYTGDAQVEITETINVRHKGDATDFFLTFSAGQSGDFSSRIVMDIATSETLPYQIYDGATGLNVLKDLSGAVAAGDVLTGSFGQSSGWQILEVSYIIRIPAGEYARSGTYDDSFQVTLYEGDLAAWTEKDSENVSLKITVGEIVQISLVGSGQPFDPFKTEYLMDFGFFEEGEVLGADLMVRANTIFSAAVESAGAGVMTNTDPADTSTVPYDFVFQGSSVNLAGGAPVTILQSLGPTTYDGLRFGFTVTILPFGMATEGDYEDTLTVTITTN